jgi:general secretion pathway protein F
VTAAGTAFSYTAVDRAGKRLRGQEAAPTAAALTQALEARGLLVLAVTAAGHPSEKQVGGLRLNRQREVLEVTRALAALLPAGLPLARALSVASTLVSGGVSQAIDAVRARTERGDRLTAALADHREYFSPLYLGLIRAGERSGDLAGAFGRLAVQLEQEEALRGRLLSASIYPMLLAAAGGLAILVLLGFVIPRFVELLEGTGAALPATTRLLLDTSAAVKQYWAILAALPVLGALCLAWSRTTEEGRRAASAFLLRIPGVGALRRQALGARVGRVLATLLGGGVPLLAALDDTIECLDDPLARDELMHIRDRVRAGSAFHLALADSRSFPPILGQLVSVGEESGRLQEFLLKSAEVLEGRTQRAVERLVALAEPVMILVFGGMVGLVALSLLQAIYSVNAGTLR